MQKNTTQEEENNKILRSELMWMNFKDVMISQNPDRKEWLLHDSPFTWNSEKQTNKQQEKKKKDQS